MVLHLLSVYCAEMCVFGRFCVAWRVADISGWGPGRGCLSYVLGFFVSCSFVSVIWMRLGVWCDRRLDFFLFHIWQIMSGSLILLWIGCVCLDAWDIPLSLCGVVCVFGVIFLGVQCAFFVLVFATVD